MLILLSVAAVSLFIFYYRKTYIDKSTQTVEEYDMDLSTPSLSLSFDMNIDDDYLNEAKHI